MLGSGEKLLKSWNYATDTVKKGFSKTETGHILTVTNKRLISENVSARKTAKTEVPLSDVKRIDLVHEVGSNVGGIILIILGALLAVFAVAIEEIPTVLAILGLVFVICGILMLGKGRLSIVVYSKDKYCVAMVAGAGNFVAKAARGKMKIRVNNHIAAEIMDSLGAYIFGGYSAGWQPSFPVAPVAPVAPAAPAAPVAPAAPAAPAAQAAPSVPQPPVE